MVTVTSLEFKSSYKYLILNSLLEKLQALSSLVMCLLFKLSLSISLPLMFYMAIEFYEGLIQIGLACFIVMKIFFSCALSSSIPGPLTDSEI